MPWQRWIEKVRAVATAGNRDHELQQELENHAALLEDEYLQQGQTPEQARRMARMKLGNTTALRDAHADQRGLPALEDLWRDCRLAARSLKRDSGFTIFAALIGTLGIGVATAIFSIVNAMLLRPLPVEDPERVVWISKFNPGTAGDRSSETVPVNPFVEYRQQSRSFSGLAAFFAFYDMQTLILNAPGGNAEQITGIPVSSNFFPVLGVRPLAGRTLTAEECQANLPVVMISEGFWKRRFGSDPAIVGRVLTIDNKATTVTGVIPFDFGAMFAPGTNADLFLPLPLTNNFNRMGNTLTMVGRLKPDVTMRAAQAEADVLAGPIGARNNRDGMRFSLMTLDDRVRNGVRPVLLVLAGAALAVLLVLCANVAHLQLARSAARFREVSIRVALGAGRGRLLRQILTENLLLFACCGALGAVLAFVLTRVLAGLSSIRLPLRESVALDGQGLLFAAAVAVIASLVCSCAAALQLQGNVFAGLKESSRAMSGGRRQKALRAAFVVTEIALACVLLTGAGLLVRSLQKVMEASLGFQPEHAASIQVTAKGNTLEARNAFFDDVLGRVRGVPGISAAGLTDVLPLGGNRSWTAGAKEKVYSISQPPPDVFVRIVSDGYMKAMGIPLIAGRDLDERDREKSAQVIVINESLARNLWPGENAVGKFIKYVGRSDREVVGVVADVRHLALERGGGNEIYVPMRQTGDYSAVNVVFRSNAAPAAALSAVRDALRTLETNLPVNSTRILTELVDQSVASRRLTAAVLSGFAGFTLLLAGLGIFGLVSYSVTQREQEIGVRMALGATSGSIQAGVLRETLVLTAIGAGLGLAASLVGSRTMAALLYEVEGTDPRTLLPVCFVLAAIALVAGFIPSVRASRTPPSTALRAG